LSRGIQPAKTIVLRNPMASLSAMSSGAQIWQPTFAALQKVSEMGSQLPSEAAQHVAIECSGQRRVVGVGGYPKVSASRSRSGCRTNSCSVRSTFGPAASMSSSTSRPGSMHGSFETGFRRLVSKQAHMGRTRCGERKLRRFTRRQTTCAPFSCYSVTQRWTAPSAISVLNWKMISRLQRPLK
jgi:hypothetical protein